MTNKLIIASVVTKNCLKEFLLTKYSCELFNKCNWYVSCDSQSAKELQKFENVKILQFDLEDGASDHNSTDKESRDRFLKIILTIQDYSHKSVDVESVISFELESDNTIPDKPVGVPSRTNSVKTPEPDAIVAPVNEKPNKVVPPADTVNPALAAAPPEALIIVVPSMLN